MKYKVNEATIQLLHERYECACNGWLLELLNMWELDGAYGYWVGDEPGGVYCYGESITINMEEIIFCVENGVTEEAFMEWSDYCTWANEFNQSTPSLKSWMKGCPRCSKETMEHLTNLKREFEEACEDASSRLVNQSF